MARSTERPPFTPAPPHGDEGIERLAAALSRTWSERGLGLAA